MEKSSKVTKLGQVLIIFTSIFIFLNLSTPPHSIFLSGEYPFSFNYLGHINNILFKYIFNPSGILQLSNCLDCPALYGLSPWYTLWTFMVNLPGQLLGFNPFIFYQLVNFATQITSLYFLLKVVFVRIHQFPFIIAALLFIYIPQKIYLMPSGSPDGLVQAIITAIIGLLLYLFKKSSTFTPKQFGVVSILLGFFFGTALNISLTHFPIIFYLTIFLVLSDIWLSRKITLTTLFTLFVSAVIGATINFPFIYSQLISGNHHSFSTYTPFSAGDSLYAGNILAGANTNFTVIIFLLILFLLLVSSISYVKKLLIIIVYLLITFILGGGVIQGVSFYQMVFDHLPFMNHLRSLYRFAYFQDLIIYFCVYLGLLKLNKSVRFLCCLISVIILIYLTQYVSEANLFYQTNLPSEYFQVQSYLSGNLGNVVYFPAYWSPQHPNMTGNYNWSSLKANKPTLYNNPFTSVLAIPNMINFENLNLPFYEAQLRSLIDYSNNPEEIISALRYSGIKYLIVDRYFHWSENFPNFNLDEFIHLLTPEKQFGLLSVYNLLDKSLECLPSFGDYRVGYCQDINNPKYLINKGPQDYLLGKISLNYFLYKIPFKNSNKPPAMITNVAVSQKVYEKQYSVPYEIYTIDHPVSNIFLQRLAGGEYKLFIPTLKLDSVDNTFGSIELVVNKGNNVIARINPYSIKPGMNWDEINFGASPGSTLTINSIGKGFIIIGRPLLFPLSVWQQFTDSFSSNYKFTSIKDPAFPDTNNYMNVLYHKSPFMPSYR